MIKEFFAKEHVEKHAGKSVIAYLRRQGADYIRVIATENYARLDYRVFDEAAAARINKELIKKRKWESEYLGRYHGGLGFRVYIGKSPMQRNWEAEHPGEDYWAEFNNA